jgi:hypothetical protein
MSAQSNKISSQQLQDKLKRVLSDVVSKEDKNLFIIQTPKGLVKVWSELSKEDFIKQLKKRK